jgi:hypothetical protein
MSEQTERVGDVDAANDKLALRDQAVHIITVTDSHGSPDPAKGKGHRAKGLNPLPFAVSH